MSVTLVATVTPPIPLTVIGGYLGAGKTTLVNHLLRHANGVKLAVMVNDFGALPIDKDLIESQDGNVIGISGGCVCCSYGSDLIDALIDMQARVPRPDHMIIETSGVALPGPVASSVTLVAGYEVDGIVVLVDAETVRERGEDRYLADTIERQLADANLVVVNKIDLVAPARLSDTIAWVASKAPRARLIETSQAALPPEIVIGCGLGYATPAGFHLPRHVLAGYATKSYDLPAGVDPHALAEALCDPALALLRAKGFVISTEAKVYALQLVASRAVVTAVVDGHRPSRSGVVVIGLANRLDLPAIDRVFARFSHPSK